MTPLLSRLRRWSAEEWPILIMAAGSVVLCSPFLIGQRVLYWGTPLLQFLPWRAYALSVLRQGRLPLWNPLLGMGAPLLANYQSALVYPPHLLLLVVDPAWGFGLLLMLHLVWAGVGMALLARRLGIDRLGQCIAGLAFGLSGYLVARSGFFSINATAAWLPWIILAADRMAAALPESPDWRARIRACIPLAVVLAFQWTAGHAQTAWYSLVLLSAWVIWRSFASRGWRRPLINMTGLAAAGVSAFALAAPQLLPTLEYLAQSYRAETLDPAMALTYSFWPWRFLGLLAPSLFGSPASGDYWGYGYFWEDAIYIGVLPLLLALFALARAIRRRGLHGGLTVFLAGVGAVAIVLALGDHTPVFPWLFRNVPTFGLFQAPSRWMLLFVFGLALLAGAGATAWAKVEGRALYWSRLGTAGAGAVAGAAWVARLVLPGVEPTLIRATSIAGVWLFLAGVLVLLRREQASAWWTAAVAVVVTADVVIAGIGLNPVAASDLYRGRSLLADSVDDGHRAYFPADLEQEVKFDWAFQFDRFDTLEDWRFVRESGLPNVTLLDSIPSASNFDPLQPERWVEWMKMLGQAGDPEPLLRLMDVGWLAVSSPSHDVPVEYRRLSGGARVRLVPEARVVESAEAAMAAVSDRGFDPEAVVILEAEAGGGPVPASGGGGTAVVVPSEDPNRVTIDIDADGPSWLLLSDVWYPGWEARLDGEATVIWRADYLFRAVPVPSGEHLVEFSYRPLSFVVGLILAVAAVLGLVGAGVWSRSRSMAREPSAPAPPAL
jgi:hypothetical protein